MKKLKKENSIKLFEQKKIRSVWSESNEEWYFSVVDVVGVLSDSVNPTDYLKKLRKRDTLLAKYIGTNCPQITMNTETGRKSCHLIKCEKQATNRNKRKRLSISQQS